MVGSEGGACSAVVGWATSSHSIGAVNFDFRLRVGQFLAIDSFVFSQLIRSSAFRPPPNNTGAESSTAVATAAERPLLEGTTMGGTGTTAKWTPIFPHNAVQAHGP